MSKNHIGPDAPLTKGNQILVENAHGDRRYMGRIQAEYSTDENGKREWWPVKGTTTPRIPRVTKVVAAPKPKPVSDEEDEDDEHTPTKVTPVQDTVASVIERLKETKTEEEARAVVGDDTRKSVLKALDLHIKNLSK